MKRKKFMDGVSHVALMHREIKGMEIAKHLALSGLTDEFRKSANWRGPQVPPDGESMVVRMLRLPHDEPNPTEKVFLVFVDSTNHKGDPKEISLDAVKQLLSDILQHVRPMAIDFYKAGAVVWDDLGFPPTADWVAGLLGLKEPDEATARAFQSAQLGTFISNVGPIDPEAITVAIGTFIHSHPAFKELIDGKVWAKPYGDRTAYQLLGAD